MKRVVFKLAVVAMSVFAGLAVQAQEHRHKEHIHIPELDAHLLAQLQDLKGHIGRVKDLQPLIGQIGDVDFKFKLPGENGDPYDQPPVLLDQTNDPELAPGIAEKIKVISKTYSVGRAEKLAINNQYGQVAVKVWDKNEIRVNIEIKAYESSDDLARRLLESVSIADSRQTGLISFKTNFERTSTNFWSRIRNGKEERRGVQVNYEIFMPARNPLDINNRYGSIIMGDFTGPINITSSYGSFAGGKLDNPANQLRISYGSADIREFSHGSLTVTYGTLKLQTANKLNASVKYSSAKISRLATGGSFEVSYSPGFRIDDVDTNVKNLVINSSYSGVTLGIDEKADFNFDVTVSYAGFNYNDSKINLVSQMSGSGKAKVWSPSKTYTGHMGKGSDARIIVKSSYGNVRFL